MGLYMFKTLLIANRGEIACRIIKTARRLGIKTIAIYSDIDNQALHVKLADKAYKVGAASSQDSYLNIDKIISIAIETQAEAIHPGYGFLSENPEFAKACGENNIIWVGPSVEAMEVMASKQIAKQKLEQTNVPLTPGFHGKDQGDEQLRQEAIKIGFPLLIKAANGGGGKGMRLVQNEHELRNAFASSRREAKKAFGDDTIILERYLKYPRHIEVQILADHYGNVIHLFDRDCSIQRRNQKVIEEAPALNLSDNLRAKMRNAAIEVAKTINYQNAGTVEFLVDEQENFYFIEMNTRLQVEHPVTEMVTGIDLVEWQLRIACGEKLFPQEDITCKGHAIECRINAEDPENNFLPSIGKVRVHKLPENGGVRLDSGIEDDANISIYYDPMLAKLIGYGQTREEAAKNLIHALSDFHLTGIKTNIPLHQAILTSPDFYQTPNTGFLELVNLNYATINIEKALLFAIAKTYISMGETLTDPLRLDTIGFQLYQKSSWIWRYSFQGKEYEVKVQGTNSSSFVAEVEQQSFEVSLLDRGPTLQPRDVAFRIDLGSSILSAYIYQNDDIFDVFTAGCQIKIEKRNNFFQHETLTDAAHAKLTAPMPGTIVAILKNKGDEVQRGDKLCILEAMKMEHTICAPYNGMIEDIFYKVGEQVAEGEYLINLIPEEAA